MCPGDARCGSGSALARKFMKRRAFRCGGLESLRHEVTECAQSGQQEKRRPVFLGAARRIAWDGGAGAEGWLCERSEILLD